MDYNYLADLLFPDVTLTPVDMEARYPRRQLPEGAKVTRFAPSPTGYVHFGGLFPTTVSERLAHQSGGVFYLRIEDTDAKREVPGAKEALINTLAHYGIVFDEGAVIGGDKGDYGPYTQSEAARDLSRIRKAAGPRRTGVSGVHNSGGARCSELGSTRKPKSRLRTGTRTTARSVRKC